MGKLIVNGIEYASAPLSGFPPLIYSTDEREVGVWIDGKPLYQRTIFTDQLPNNELKNIPHNISNIDKIVNMEAVAHAKLSVDANNTFTSVPRIQDNNTTNANMGLDVTATNIVLKGRSSSVNFSSLYEYVMVTLQYTKTTDTPGSGKWVSNGNIAHHYSTSEQVIGTWINGKPLYERTFSVNISCDYNKWTDTDIINDFNFERCIFSFAVGDGTASASILAALKSENNHLMIMNLRNTTVGMRYFTIQYTKTTD